MIYYTVIKHNKQVSITNILHMTLFLIFYRKS